MTVCRHCHTRPPGKGHRGLCNACYYVPGLRQRYPSTSRYASLGLGIATPTRQPDRPVAARQGTPEKVAELERRAAAGMGLWHPLDVVRDTEETPGPQNARQESASPGERRFSSTMAPEGELSDDDEADSFYLGSRDGCESASAVNAPSRPSFQGG